ncbi:MAG: ATP-binding cassette domain-containing protein [Eubacterium sp.]|nr:ATP-binding cassette domain-containing protein [Eubacterium sp.]
MSHYEIKNLSFSYAASPDRKTLDHVSLKIERGQYITVCGRSGSGKTTLLKHLKSVLTPHGTTTGEILFEGTPLKDVDMRTQTLSIGYVMQNPDSQIVTDKVWHELAFGLESLGLEQQIIRTRVAEMASYFGIQGWFHKNVADLSGGQKQLLNLASIMAMQPSVLILDEPTSQLDPIAAADFLNTVKKINRELRTTIIITEHRLEDIFYASDKVLVMEHGGVLAYDEPRKIGAFLKEQNNEMFAAMPTPVQIYYGVNEQGTCPLTVREGAEWLDEMFAEKAPVHTRIEEDEKLAGAYGDKAKDIAAAMSKGEPIKDPAIAIKEAWFRYERDGADILKDLSLQVPRESIYAIVGGNGTGKSTTLKTICNICRPYRGKVIVDGKPVAKHNQQELFRGTLAMLPQDPQSLFAKMTVREELEEVLGFKDPDKAEKIAQVAETCEITYLLDSHPYDISGGEQQRAALAKILLTNPKILLMDEPTKGIDDFFKIKFAQIIKRLQSQGVTIVMVSHDVEFCAKYADYVSMFFDGSIVSTNTPNRFFSQNSFYTTAANRMSRHVFENAINNEDVITLCLKNQ